MIVTPDHSSPNRQEQSDSPHRTHSYSDQRRVVAALEQASSALDTRVRQLERQLANVLKLLEHLTPDQWALIEKAREAPFAVYCLGRFKFLVDGTPVESWRSGKARALFQYLVCHRDRPIPRHTLIEALWPDPDAVASGTSLKVAVHALRQVINQVAGPDDAIQVVAHGSSYELCAPCLWIDVEEFERCYTFGRWLESQGRLADALPLYARAADLYQGDFLEDVWEDWAMFRRELLKDQYLAILAALAKASAEAGDYHGCIARCQRILEKDRCREDTYRLLMICHGRLGQRSRVRFWFDFCVRTLRAELDVAPEPETETTFRLALNGKV